MPRPDETASDAVPDPGVGGKAVDQEERPLSLLRVCRQPNDGTEGDPRSDGDEAAMNSAAHHRVPL
jgi:hypothetical protein